MLARMLPELKTEHKRSPIKVAQGKKRKKGKEEKSPSHRSDLGDERRKRGPGRRPVKKRANHGPTWARHQRVGVADGGGAPPSAANVSSQWMDPFRGCSASASPNSYFFFFPGVCAHGGTSLLHHHPPHPSKGPSAYTHTHTHTSPEQFLRDRQSLYSVGAIRAG
jgi:hypothetical protein